MADILINFFFVPSHMAYFCQHGVLQVGNYGDFAWELKNFAVGELHFSAIPQFAWPLTKEMDVLRFLLQIRIS